jgi:hypothetical protein
MVESAHGEANDTNLAEEARRLSLYGRPIERLLFEGQQFGKRGGTEARAMDQMERQRVIRLGGVGIRLPRLRFRGACSPNATRNESASFGHLRRQQSGTQTPEVQTVRNLQSDSYP